MSIEISRKKILFQAKHRGTKEMDVILGQYAEKEVKNMGEHELKLFEKIMHMSDIDLYNWITGKEDLPQNINNEILQKIINEQAKI